MKAGPGRIRAHLTGSDRQEPAGRNRPGADFQSLPVAQTSSPSILVYSGTDKLRPLLLTRGVLTDLAAVWSEGRRTCDWRPNACDGRLVTWDSAASHEAGRSWPLGRFEASHTEVPMWCAIRWTHWETLQKSLVPTAPATYLLSHSALQFSVA